MSTLRGPSAGTPGPRTPRERRAEIVERATAGGLASVSELSEHFGVTPSTIRRDLAALESQRRLARTFGGAIAVDGQKEAPLRQRLTERSSQKRAIARWAAGCVAEGDAILLDNGSTVAAMVPLLALTRPLTVGTTSLRVIRELAHEEGDDLELIGLGGRYRGLSDGFVGALTEIALEHLTFDAAFLGADAVSPERGLCEADLGQVRLKELMARSARHVHVLADSSKLEGEPFKAWTQLRPAWSLITDDGADESIVRRFRERGVAVHVVPVTAQD